MKPNLNLQTDVFWEDERKDTQAIIGKYFDVSRYTDKWVHGCSAFSLISPMRGSMLMAQKAGLKFEHANALKWLPRFRQHCVSNEAVFLDLKEILHQLAIDDSSAFVRPVSPFKEIAGEVFDAERLDTEIRFLEQNKNIRADELICLMAPPKHLSYEWRCVFVNNEFISSSLYMKDGQPLVGGEAPTQVINFARKIGADDYFLNVFNYVIDVALVGQEIKVVEINGFETASFYACDLNKIYAALAGSRILD